MTRAMLPVLLLVAVGLGFAAGWVWHTPPPQPITAPTTAAPAAPAPTARGTERGPDARKAQRPAPVTPSTRTDADLTITELLDEADALRKQLRKLTEANRRLEQRLANAEATQREAEGVPFDRPAVVPTRQTQARQMEVFKEALEALEVDGEVESVDCAELPCFVHGRLSGHDSGTLDDDLGRLIEATRGAMGDDDVYASRSIYEDPEHDKADMSWSISWYPPGWHAADKEAFNKRLRFRKNEYADSIHP